MDPRRSTALVVTVFAALVALTLGVATLSARQEGTPPRLVFEVASVRRNVGEPGPPRYDSRGFRTTGRVTVTNMSLRDIIRLTYGDPRENTRLVNDPPWLRTERFDITAVGAVDPATDPERPPGAEPLPSFRMRGMMQSLLEDRFKLRIHVERQQFPNYSLKLANGRRHPALRAAAPCVWPGQPLAPGAPPASGGQPPAGEPCALSGNNRLGLTARGVSLEALAAMLGLYPEIGRPVVDATGVSGPLDFTLTVDQAPPKDALDASVRFTTALREQLGLVLESGVGTAETYVVDSVEMPEPD